MDLPDKIELEIVTPEQLVFSGQVDEVNIPGSEGYFGVLPGHTPLLSELRVGVISYLQGDTKVHLFCGRGFVEILPNRISVLAEVVKMADNIDVKDAMSQKNEAETLLRSLDENVDYVQTMDVLEQATVQLELAEKAARNRH